MAKRGTLKHYRGAYLPPETDRLLVETADRRDENLSETIREALALGLKVMEHNRLAMENIKELR